VYNSIAVSSGARRANVYGRDRPEATASGISRICDCDDAGLGSAVNVAEQHRDSGCCKGVECRLGSRQVGRQDGGFRVEERKGQFFTGSPAVDWNHDRADLDGCGEGDEPVRAVAHRDGQPIAGCDAEIELQGRRKRVDVGEELLVGPASVVEHQQFGVAVLAQRLNDVDGGRGGVHKHLVSGACELTFAHFQRLAGSG
jgi:hypothetical protein